MGKMVQFIEATINYKVTDRDTSSNSLLIRSTITRQKNYSGGSGSPEVQIKQLTIRVNKLSKHLQEHTHDNATKRGLILIIGKRLGLLRYLEKKDYQRYSQICGFLGIKKLKSSIR